jgi:hypothetical protein
LGVGALAPTFSKFSKGGFSPSGHSEPSVVAIATGSADIFIGRFLVAAEKKFASRGWILKVLSTFHFQLSTSKSFLVIIPRGSHPFPSRTRKLSLAGPMILHG